MIVYWGVPYLVVAAPPLILLLSILIGGCTMRQDAAQLERTGFYSDPNSRAGEELVRELDRREARQELRRIVEEASDDL